MELKPYADACLRSPMRADKSYTLFQFLACVFNVRAGVRSTAVDYTERSIREFVKDEDRFQVIDDVIPRRVSKEVTLTSKADPTFRKVRKDGDARTLFRVLSLRGYFPNFNNPEMADAHYREFRALLRCAELEDGIRPSELGDVTGVKTNAPLLEKLRRLDLVESYTADGKKRPWRITERGRKLTEKVDELADIFEL